MSRYYLMSIDTLKTICQGALGAVTFGTYHQFTTNKIMEQNNEILNTKHKQDLERMETEHRKEMDSLNRRYELLEERMNKRRF